LNPETVKTLSALLELLEEMREELEKDIKAGQSKPGFFNVPKYSSLVKKYYVITNLKP